MPLVCLGMNHRTAPVEVRERHAFPLSKAGELLTALRDYSAVRECVMTSTCGRLEFYAELDDYELGVAQLKSFLTNFRHGEVGDLDSYLYTHLGKQAVTHLLRVSTGLDSMVLGEAQILGQVKEAYVQAQLAGSVGKVLHRLFHEALQTGKAARAQTGIGADSASIGSAAVDLARAQMGSLEGKRVLVIGAGRMGTLVARRLRHEHVGEIVVANRSFQRAEQVVLELGTGKAVSMPGIVNVLSEADIVITSTGASHFILTPQNVGEAMERRPDRPLCIVDIAVPRDADPEVAEIPEVALHDVDALTSVVEEHIEARREHIPVVNEIIAEHVSRFQEWYQTRSAVPLISSLVERAEGVREREIARLFQRLPELSDRERMLVTGASMTIVSRLLHVPVTRIRELAATNQAEAMARVRVLGELFALDGQAPAPPSANGGTDRAE
ncbi:MAG TPA: glutamyl-tRNA reductase [Candidatus Dormibacteraeota bacterium]|nr:glutamyl-tRNA reductase [Candidatus Dormibacteraeota bacterium]